MDVDNSGASLSRFKGGVRDLLGCDRQVRRLVWAGDITRQGARQNHIAHRCSSG
jgi:hypothetical protein